LGGKRRPSTNPVMEKPQKGKDLLRTTSYVAEGYKNLEGLKRRGQGNITLGLPGSKPAH